MIYRETGQMPLELQIKSRVLCYWARLINSKDAKIHVSNVLYRTIISLHVSNSLVAPWISYVNNTLNGLGLSYYFESQHVYNFSHFKNHRYLKCR